jgi:hypothetical protein
MTSDEITAAATVVAAVAAVGALIVAIVAAKYAKGQLDEARGVREEQAQPYVTATLEPSPASFRLIDLVLKNLGTTAAYDVQLTSDPPMRRIKDGDYAGVWPGDVIRTLVPGQEWRTFWDSSYEWINATPAQPARYKVTLTFRDSKDKEHRFESVLDWDVFRSRLNVDVKGEHDAAKALIAISATVGKWTEDHRGGLAVFTRDGEAKDQRAEESAKQLRRHLGQDTQ